MPISEAILGNLVKSATDGLIRLVQDGRGDKLRIDYSRTTEALLDHLAVVDNWSSSISMLHLRRDKMLAEAFVELSLDIGYLPYTDDADESSTVLNYEQAHYDRRHFEQPATITELFASNEHVAILGGPGAGKTTSLQKIAQLTLRNREAGNRGVPVLVTLRDLRDSESLVAHLLAKLGIAVRLGSPHSDLLRCEWERRALHRYLDRAAAILLVDGLDEVNPVSRPRIEDELREIALASGAHRIFLTCRTAEYHLDLKRVQPYTIRPLTRKQIVSFATRWLGRAKGFKLVDEIERHPYSGTEVIPLRLAHLCALYERHGRLPPRSIDVYGAIVSLLVEDWDKQRGVRRYSEHAGFTPRRKERFLQSLAFEITMAGRRGVFSYEDFRAAYQRISVVFDLPAEDEESVLEEIESHTGIISRAGYHRYEFVHLVIQEFLCSVHAHRLPDGLNILVPQFPNEVALTVAYSFDVNEYLRRILLLIEPSGTEAVHFVVPFLARLRTEGVDVVPSAEVGWVILGYVALISSHAVEYFGPYATVQTIQVDFRDFFLRSGVAQSIDMALSCARVTKDQLGTVWITRGEGAETSTLGVLTDYTLVIRSSSGLTRLLPARILNAASDCPMESVQDA